jgi:hypothetical protein
MFSKVSIASPTILVLVLGLLAQSAGPLPAEAGGVQGPVIRGDQLTKQQFEALPDSAVIEFKGRRMTKGQIRAKAAKSTETMARGQAPARAAQARVAARHAQFLQQQQAQLQADNAKAMAEFGRLRQVAAIEQEAAQLFQRSKTAAPAERAQIDQRAAQLLQQLQQLGR